MRHVANLATYPHTEAQRDKIMSEIDASRRMVSDAFTPKARDDEFKF
jgi:hypothetical protein